MEGDTGPQPPRAGTVFYSKVDEGTFENILLESPGWEPGSGAGDLGPSLLPLPWAQPGLTSPPAASMVEGQQLIREDCVARRRACAGTAAVPAHVCPCVCMCPVRTGCVQESTRPFPVPSV